MPASMVSADERSGRSSARAADQEEIAHELARLEALDLTGLRVQFRNRTGRVAPTRISRPLLLRLIGYRLQAERFGDLPPDTKRFLDRLASASAGSLPNAPPTDDRASVAAAEGRMRPRTGTVLVREWQGRLEQVRVLPDGFGWNGTTHASLSAAAFAITGTRWNGHRFFGLGRHGKAAQASGAGVGKAARVGRTTQASQAGASARMASAAGTSPLDRSQSRAAGSTGTVVHVGRAEFAELAPVSTAAVIIPPAHRSAGATA